MKKFYSHGEWTRVKNGRINYDRKHVKFVVESIKKPINLTLIT